MSRGRATLAMRLPLALALVASGAVLAALVAPQRALGACKPATDLHLIIDDSFSMTANDADRLRVDAVKMLLSKLTNQEKFAGATQFGAAASEVFPPRKIGSNLSGMLAALDAGFFGNGGGTNYNEAWAAANAAHGLADARIFLTDGMHTEGGDYANGHRAISAPVYVIGFADAGSADNPELLKQIASETNGRYYGETSSASLTSAVNEIDAIINCRAVPRTFRDSFETGRTRPTHTAPLARKTKTIDVVVSWEDPDDSFDVASIQVLGRKRVIGRSAGARKLKVTRNAGATYLSLQIKNLSGARKLRFSVKAKKLASPSTNVISQVSQIG